MPRVSDDVWMLFVVPCPVPDGRMARDVYEKRVTGITDEMRIDAARGCRFHRAWHAADGSAFYARAHWDSRDAARGFFERWQIDDEAGERAILLEGDIGLVALG